LWRAGRSERIRYKVHGAERLPDAPLALRLRSHRVAAGLTRKELEEAAGLGTGRAKDFEQGAAKPQEATGPGWPRSWAPRIWSGSAIKATGQR
jgi:hypothetical protein